MSVPTANPGLTILLRFTVGATQDLAAFDIDLAAITQAGGWKSTRMPLQYAERINTGRSGMARAAEKAGRNQAVSE
jgi:hypothetical protein